MIQNEYYNLQSLFRAIPASQILFSVEIIQRILELTSSLLATEEVRQQALVCLALYCKVHEGSAMLLINQQGVIELLWGKVVENDTTGVAEKVSWLFAVISSVQIVRNVFVVGFQQIVGLFFK